MVVNPSARPVPAKEDDSLLYIIVIAAVAAVAGVAVVLIAAVLVAILVILVLKRRRNRQKPSRMYAPNAIPLEGKHYMACSLPRAHLMHVHFYPCLQ